MYIYIYIDIIIFLSNLQRILQRTSVSTNIKERLDFSCALFGPGGGLVSNAPHIPVHLGAMQEAVQYQVRRPKTIDDFKEDLLIDHFDRYAHEVMTSAQEMCCCLIIHPPVDPIFQI